MFHLECYTGGSCGKGTYTIKMTGVKQRATGYCHDGKVQLRREIIIQLDCSSIVDVVRLHDLDN